MLINYCKTLLFDWDCVLSTRGSKRNNDNDGIKISSNKLDQKPKRSTRVGT
jgi:hypothetical protein